ncbi:FMN-binding protein [Ruminococcaceae bacterium OttesenSCG-928-A16]|nr:FMN-binding protein [Ruminococcaceae bacterium OttesenSCG-928-A16]
MSEETNKAKGQEVTEEVVDKKPAAPKKETKPAAKKPTAKAAAKPTAKKAEPETETKTEKAAEAATAKKAEEKKVWTRQLPVDEIQKAAAQQQADTAEEAPAAKPGPAKAKLAKPTSEVWQVWLRPVVVLVVICLITSLLLGVTNSITLPLVTQNAAAAEDAARKELLPSATNFENVTPTPLPDNIMSVYKADGDAGYVVGAYGKGYGGKVPALVAINAEGQIAGVKFLENGETPGLGQKLITDKNFTQQFTGRSADKALDNSDIDGIAAATLSTNAALTAINAATNYYNINIMGGTLAYNLPEDALAQLMPKAKSWQQLEVKADKIAGAYLGDDGTYVLVAQGQGEKTLYAAVAMDNDGTITALWLDTSKETPTIGLEMSENQEYIDQYVGQKDTAGVQGVAGVTHTSDGILSAVEAALAALPAAKEVA